ncbi:hypothetical protein Afil01_45950 [Actinorhabdospora filicis]|uniref:Uncharacterized protein n=1 Tax=Actinorhabdospora filicis TaxID=1785913 RepID=A0A9W6SP43_9ACTN|nr:hypothetical protein [Actinorhabdospora filicis]GLZ79788.1 hypothetical protein Afil01_45950 [Actinorhabdospora filicis]
MPHHAFAVHPDEHLADRGLADFAGDFAPLTGPILDLAGDPAWLSACAGTWRVMAAALADDRGALLASAETDLPGTWSPEGLAYRRRVLAAAESVGRMSSRALDLVAAAEAAAIAVERARGRVIEEFLGAVAALRRASEPVTVPEGPPQPPDPERVAAVLAGPIARVRAILRALDGELEPARTLLATLTVGMREEAGRLTRR